MPSVCPCTSTSEALAKTRAGLCGGIVYSEMASVFLSHKKENCDFVPAGSKFLPQNFIFGIGDTAVVEGRVSPTTMNYWVAVLRETGFLRQLQVSYFDDTNECGTAGGPTTAIEDLVIDVDAMMGIFIVLFLASGGIVSMWFVDYFQHQAFLKLIFSRYDGDGSGVLDDSEVMKLLISMGLTPEATAEDPKTLDEHMSDMAAYTPEPGVRFKEFSSWWDNQPYALRVAIFKKSKAKTDNGMLAAANVVNAVNNMAVDAEKAGGNDE